MLLGTGRYLVELVVAQDPHQIHITGTLYYYNNITF